MDSPWVAGPLISVPLAAVAAGAVGGFFLGSTTYFVVFAVGLAVLPIALSLGRPPRRIGLTAGIAVLLSGAALVPVHDRIRHAAVTDSLTSPGEIGYGVGEISRTAGTGRLSELVLSPDFFVATGLQCSYTYRDGEATADDPGRQPARPEDLFDVHEVRLDAVPGLVAEAKRRFGMPQPDQLYVGIHRTTGDRPDRPIEIGVHLSQGGRNESLVADAEGRPALGVDALTPEGARAVTGDIAAKMGHGEVWEVQLAADNGSVTAPSRPGAASAEDWLWNSGRLIEHEPGGLAPHDRLFDLRAVDFTLVPKLLARLRAESGIARTPGSGSAGIVSDQGQLVYSVSVRDDRRSASLTARADGTVLDSWSAG